MNIGNTKYVERTWKINSRGTVKLPITTEVKKNKNNDLELLKSC